MCNVCIMCKSLTSMTYKNTLQNIVIRQKQQFLAAITSAIWRDWWGIIGYYTEITFHAEFSPSQPLQVMESSHFTLMSCGLKKPFLADISDFRTHTSRHNVIPPPPWGEWEFFNVKWINQFWDKRRGGSTLWALYVHKECVCMCVYVCVHATVSVCVCACVQYAYTCVHACLH